MKIKAIVVSISLLLIAASYPSHLKGKIKTIYMDKWRDTVTYQYDNKGRILVLTASRGFKTTYTYQSNTIIADTKGGSHVTMFLNSKGLVDSLIDMDSNRITRVLYSPEGAPSPQFSMGARRSFPYSGHDMLGLENIATVTSRGIAAISKKYIYDEAGFIKGEKIYTNGTLQVVSTHTAANGNIISYSVRYPVRDTIYHINPKTLKIDTSIVRQIDFTVKNTFDPGKKNTLATDPFFGRSSGNILLCSVAGQGANDSTITTYKYTFDKLGRATSLITSVRSTDPPEYNYDAQMSDTCAFTYY